ncbi:hypothetical protein ZIOFF_057008 [Zingiber officinale]|uniref:Uridine kinase n=1 Tax=Zingiber officinale TaxID=94328 RepID=A0A8J5FEM2_ZINOF|nr:hypothetical protein ZIOFF_057008 [Zingiber officinale]
MSTSTMTRTKLMHQCCCVSWSVYRGQPTFEANLLNALIVQHSKGRLEICIQGIVEVPLVERKTLWVVLGLVALDWRVDFAMHLEVLFVWVANFHHWTLLVTQLAPVCFHPSFLIGEHVAALTYLHEYSKFVKPAFDDFILPTKKYTDIIIPRGGDNHVAIDLIVQHIHTKLGQHNLCKIYPNLSVIQSTFQIRGMHTLIRDAKTTTHDFIFYSDRLIRLVVEHGLGHLPFKEKQIITPTGAGFFHCPVLIKQIF